MEHATAYGSPSGWTWNSSGMTSQLTGLDVRVVETCCWRVRVSCRSSAAEDVCAIVRTDQESGAAYVPNLPPCETVNSILNHQATFFMGLKLPRNRVSHELTVSTTRTSFYLKPSYKRPLFVQQSSQHVQHLLLRKIEFGPPLRNTECGRPHHARCMQIGPLFSQPHPRQSKVCSLPLTSLSQCGTISTGLQIGLQWLAARYNLPGGLVHKHTPYYRTGEMRLTNASWYLIVVVAHYYSTL